MKKNNKKTFWTLGTYSIVALIAQPFLIALLVFVLIVSFKRELTGFYFLLIGSLLLNRLILFLYFPLNLSIRRIVIDYSKRKIYAFRGLPLCLKKPQKYIAIDINDVFFVRLCYSKSDSLNRNLEDFYNLKSNPNPGKINSFKTGYFYLSDGKIEKIIFDYMSDKKVLCLISNIKMINQNIGFEKDFSKILD